MENSYIIKIEGRRVIETRQTEEAPDPVTHQLCTQNDLVTKNKMYTARIFKMFSFH